VTEFRQTSPEDAGGVAAATLPPPYRATDISMKYGSNTVLNSVTVELIPGTVTALVGHNGAGKSTLLRCLSGAERPHLGQLTVGSDVVRFNGPADAKALGIVCVYQELSRVDCLSVSQNIFLGTELRKGGILDQRRMDEETQSLCEEFGIRAHASDQVSRLSVAQRQLIEVAAAIRGDARYLLLDEPTTALEPNQVEHLLKMIRKLVAERDLAVLLVDHKLDEVFAIADRVMCLADGNVILDRPVEGLDRTEVVQAIIGEEVQRETRENLAAIHERVLPESGSVPPRLEVRALRAPRLPRVQMSVRPGEILGVYGLVGSGRSRFLRTLFGDEPYTSGEILLDGAPVHIGSVAQAMRQGIAYLPEERKVAGFIPIFNSIDNVILPVLKRFIRAGTIRWKAGRAIGRSALEGLRVRGSLTRPIVELSGGNQQKVLFGRAALQAPRLLLLDEPTKGVDIGAKAELHDIVRRLAREENVAVVVVSSEEEEMIALADEVCVFTAGTCDGTRYNPAEVGASGLRRLAWGDSPHEGSTR
jgi:ribose transport system ATP-binding protein